MTPASAKRVAKASQSPAIVESFKRLTLPEALDVYERANPDERKQFDAALSSKLGRAKADHYSAADALKIMQSLQRLRRARVEEKP